MANDRPSRGRPDDVKQAVVDAARAVSARQGYVNVTIKGVATAAGVAPDMVRRYFNNRDELFAAVLKLPFDPVAAITGLLSPGVEGLAERLVRTTLKMLSEPETREQIALMVRDGVGATKVAASLREFLESLIIDRVAAVLGVPDARMRVTLATSYIVGVVVTRYVMNMEPLASASEDDVVRMVTPAVQTALSGAGSRK